jgi:SPFH domain / Band 7 family
MKRIVVFGLVTAALWTAENWWLNMHQPQVAAGIALKQLNGGEAAARELRSYQVLKDSVHVAASFFTVLAAMFLLGPLARRTAAKIIEWGKRGSSSKAAVLVSALSVGLLTSGCIKPYDRPEYVEIDTSETGFLIPLEGDGAQQAKFQSEDYLKQRKVAAKRVQITHRWSQEGRLASNGRWIPAVRLIKVNRSPITREWMTAESAVNSPNRRPGRNDQAIWIESADSVGFSMGFTCTAFISEEEAAKFLYWYPSGSLTELMDREVRGRIQQVSAEVAAKYPLDDLRSRKQEISDTVKKDLTNFFALRGITITTVGMFGGMTYENPEIQKSIDQTFIAQQQKVVAEAKLQAQQKENQRLELEAQGFAEKTRREAVGQADARKTTAQGEAEAIREINRAAQEAQANPLLMQLKMLEMEKARIEKWDGHYPQWWMGASLPGSGPNLLLQAPLPESRQK